MAECPSYAAAGGGDRGDARAREHPRADRIPCIGQQQDLAAVVHLSKKPRLVRLRLNIHASPRPNQKACFTSQSLTGPPSTIRFCPVTARAHGEANNSTASAAPARRAERRSIARYSEGPRQPVIGYRFI